MDEPKPMGLRGLQIYIIGASRDGPLKIGISRDPWSRQRELQCGHADRLAVYATFFIEPDHAYFERELHRDLKPWRMAGEWFGIPIEAAMSIIWSAHLKRDLPIYPGEVGLPGTTFPDTWREYVALERAKQKDAPQ